MGLQVDAQVPALQSAGTVGAWSGALDLACLRRPDQGPVAREQGMEPGDDEVQARVLGQ